MKTVELSAALNSAQVVENLKNFVGVDAQGAAALMTPERLAAVAGGILPVANPNTNGLQDKRFAETMIFTNLKKCFLIHNVPKNASFGFILYISGSGSVNSDCGLYICGTTYEGGSVSCRYIYGAVPAGMKLGTEVKTDGSIDVYVYTDSIFGAYRILKKSVHESSNGFMVDESSKDLSSIKQMTIIE